MASKLKCSSRGSLFRFSDCLECCRYLLLRWFWRQLMLKESASSCVNAYDDILGIIWYASGDLSFCIFDSSLLVTLFSLSLTFNEIFDFVSFLFFSLSNKPNWGGGTRIGFGWVPCILLECPLSFDLDLINVT